MKNLPAVFIGESTFSYRMLEILLYNRYNIRAVIGGCKGEHEDYRSLMALAFVHKIPSYESVNANNWDYVIEDCEPKVIYCLGYRRIIKQSILDICPVVGYHPTLLPENRGPHPIIWSLVNKQTETGSTFFLMDKGIDSGDILSQEKVEIYPEDTLSSLYDRIISTARKQILTLDLKKRIPQDHTKATYLKKRVKGEESTWLEY